MLLIQTFRTSAIAVVLLASGLQSMAQAKAPKPANAVVPFMVNGQAVDGTRLDALLMEQLGQGRPDNAQLRSAIREDVIRLELLTQEARKAGIDQQAIVRAQASLAYDGVLTRAYLQQWLAKHPVKEDAIQQEYEAWKTRMGSKELQLRHVLVATEAEAQATVARLSKGEKLEDLAAALSRDANSRATGGLLGWTPAGALHPGILAAVQTLSKGQLANAPVNTPAGWHVLRLEDSRPFAPPALDALQGQIRQTLERAAAQTYVNTLRQQAKVN